MFFLVNQKKISLTKKNKARIQYIPQGPNGTTFGSGMLVLLLGFLLFCSFPCPAAALLGVPPGSIWASAAASDLVFVTAQMTSFLAPKCLFYQRFPCFLCNFGVPSAGQPGRPLDHKRMSPK